MNKEQVENLKTKPGTKKGAKAAGKEKPVAEAAAAQEVKVAPKVEERPVKIREILSDYFMRRRERIDPDLLKELKETARREATDADQYGSYKPGTFTFGSFVVFVAKEDGLWRIEIVSGEGGARIPENVVEQIRYKYVPDDAWMCKVYAPRDEQRKLTGVLLMQMPTEMKSEE